jgi:hypothetical protein
MHRLSPASAQGRLFAEDEWNDRKQMPALQCPEDKTMADGKRGETQSGPIGLFEIGERSRAVAAVGQDGKRQSRGEAKKCQKAGTTRDQGDSDSRGMGLDQGSRRESLPLLQAEDEPPHDGSRDSFEQRRPSHSVEHRSGLQELQQQQMGQDPHAPITTDVWRLGPEPFPLAHFAVFVSEIPRRAISAGTSERGVCPQCGAPWCRVVEKHLVPTPKAAKTCVVDARDAASDGNDQGSNRQRDGHLPGWARADQTLGWLPSCGCNAGAPVPATVLDPFAGAGTTGLVADRLGRDAILVELSPQYVEMARRRLRDDAGLFYREAAE